MNKLLLSLLALSTQCICLAQEKDMVSINYTAANAKQVNVKFRLPLYQKNNNFFGATLGYRNVALNQFPETYTQYLHGITIQTMWLHKFGNKKSLAIFAQAGLFSDMADISGKDFRYTAGIRYRYKHSQKLATGWGLAYSKQYFGNQVIPFFDLDYRPNEKWSITGQFPIKPKLLYHFNKQLSTGIEINGEAGSYRLSAREKNNQFIQINQWTALAKLEYQFARNWQFDFGIGKNLRQAFKLYNDASTTRWTIITIPLKEKSEPVQQIEYRGLSMQLGISFNVDGL